MSSDGWNEEAGIRLEESLRLLPAIVSGLRRRHRLSPSDAEDLESVARLKLFENDGAVLRAFRGTSTLKTYLTTVVARLFLDERIRSWGKWRPSAEARRLGAEAVDLERLTAREGLPLAEALERLKSVHPALSEARVREMSRALRVTPGRRFVGEDALSERASPEPDPEALALRREREEAARRTTRALLSALDGLEPRDRLIVRLRFFDAVPIVEIARMIHVEATPLYRRIESLLGHLRRALVASGISQAEVADLLAGERPSGIGVAEPEHSGSSVRPTLMSRPRSAELKP